MIQRIDHLNIVVTNLSESERFFNTLGFEQKMGSELDSEFLGKLTGIQKAAGRFIAMKHPASQLVIELIQYDSVQGSKDPMIGQANQIGFRHLAFAVSNIESVVKELQKNGGVKFLSSILTWEKTGKKLVYFQGPDGILMELAEYPQ